MQFLDKDTIKTEIEKYLSVGKRGFKIQVHIYQIVELILYKLKTGCQWYAIPIKQSIADKNYSFHKYITIIENG